MKEPERINKMWGPVLAARPNCDKTTRMTEITSQPEFIPPQPPNSFRIVLDLHKGVKRLDAVLLEKMKEQVGEPRLSNITRTKFKTMFKEGKIQIKGQRAGPASALAKGMTYIDILD